MSTSSPASSNPAQNPIFMAGVILIALLYAVAVTGYNIIAFAGLIGLIVFAVFVRYPEFGVYVTTALLLLQGSSGVLGVLDPDSPLAVTYAQIAGAAAMGAWATSALLGHTGFKTNAATKYLIAFCLWAFAGTILSNYAPDLLAHWARMVFRLALLILAINTLNTAKKINRYLHVLLVCAVLTSLVSVAQYVLPSMQMKGMNWASATAGGAYVDPESLQGEAAVRVSGQAGHSNWLAMTLLLLLPVNAFWFTTTKRRWARLLIIAAAVLQVTVLVLTFTRTGFIIGGAVFLMLFGGRLLKLSPLRLFAITFIAIIGISMLPDAYVKRVFNPRQYVASESVRARLALQSAAANYAVTNPIFGLGTGGFGMRFVHEGNETATQMRYVVQYQHWQAVFIGTHNMFLQIMADTGMVGFAFFMLFYYLMFKNLLAQRRKYDDVGDATGHTIVTALAISLAAFLLCALFLHALHQPIWWMIAAAAIAIPLHNVDFREIKLQATDQPAPILVR